MCTVCDDLLIRRHTSRKKPVYRVWPASCRQALSWFVVILVAAMAAAWPTQPQGWGVAPKAQSEQPKASGQLRAEPGCQSKEFTEEEATPQMISDSTTQRILRSSSTTTPFGKMGQQDGAEQLGFDTWQEGPTEPTEGQGSGARMVEPLLEIGKKKEMDQFLRRQFEKIKNAVPLMVDDPWEVMQQGTEMMVQLDAPTMCNEKQMVEVRQTAAMDLSVQ